MADTDALCDAVSLDDTDSDAVRDAEPGDGVLVGLTDGEGVAEFTLGEAEGERDRDCVTVLVVVGVGVSVDPNVGEEEGVDDTEMVEVGERDSDLDQVEVLEGLTVRVLLALKESDDVTASCKALSAPLPSCPDATSLFRENTAATRSYATQTMLCAPGASASATGNGRMRQAIVTRQRNLQHGQTMQRTRNRQFPQVKWDLGLVHHEG